MEAGAAHLPGEQQHEPCDDPADVESLEGQPLPVGATLPDEPLSGGQNGRQPFDGLDAVFRERWPLGNSRRAHSSGSLRSGVAYR